MLGCEVWSGHLFFLFLLFVALIFALVVVVCVVFLAVVCVWMLVDVSVCSWCCLCCFFVYAGVWGRCCAVVCAGCGMREKDRIAIH